MGRDDERKRSKFVPKFTGEKKGKRYSQHTKKSFLRFYYYSLVPFSFSFGSKWAKNHLDTGGERGLREKRSGNRRKGEMPTNVRDIKIAL